MDSFTAKACVLLSFLFFSHESLAIYQIRPVGRCVTTYVTDSFGYTWTSQQCWIEYEAVGGYGGGLGGGFPDYPGGGGRPGPISNPSDINGDGKLDCWKDLTGSGDYSLSENQDWGARIINGEKDFHDGIDIGAARGTPVYAVSGGTVIEAGSNTLNGNYVRINNTDGTQSVYLHLLDYAVSSGSFIIPGQNIGRVNCTGNCYGNHLHLTIWSSPGNRAPGTSLDPVDYSGGDSCQK